MLCTINTMLSCDTYENQMMDVRERWRKHRICQEAWKDKNREYYLFQKRQLACRPEYLEHRRAMYKRSRSTSEEKGLSTIENYYESKKATKTRDRCGDTGRAGTEGSEERPGIGTTLRASIEEGVSG